ncbi:MAG: hypothetical protein WDN45_11640 [Caulobacteraceae bacterium]
MGMPRAFTPGASSTLLVREHHVRFLKEARPGAGLYMTGGVLSMGQSDATLLQLLFHSTGEPAAAITRQGQPRDAARHAALPLDPGHPRDSAGAEGRGAGLRPAAQRRHRSGGDRRQPQGRRRLRPGARRDRGGDAGGLRRVRPDAA